jgi:hypothetical protein
LILNADDYVAEQYHRQKRCQRLETSAEHDHPSTSDVQAINRLRSIAVPGPHT